MRSISEAQEGAASVEDACKVLAGRSRQVWTVRNGVPKLRLYRPGITPPPPSKKKPGTVAKSSRSLADPDAPLSTQAIMVLLSQKARLIQVRALVEAGEEGLPFGQIAEYCGLPKHRVSYHLKRLRKAGLLTVRRRGRTFFFMLDSVAVEPLSACLSEIEAIIRPLSRHGGSASPVEHRPHSETLP